jgi:cytochrome c2
MSKKCALRWVGIVVLAATGLLAANSGPAHADKAFREGFRLKYVKGDSTEPKDVAFREAFLDAGCNLCHVGDERTNRNAYGQSLAKFLKRETDVKNKQKIQEALEKVAAMKSKPDDPNAPTFGEIIGQGKLPAGITK